MYELARARGEEVGAEVLWCDGGAGGLSGVSGDIVVGTGSWSKTIGVPYPAEERRTIYGYGGDLFVFALLIAASGSLWLIHERDVTVSRLPRPNITAARQALQRIMLDMRNRITGRRDAANSSAPREDTPLLIEA